MTYQCYLPWMLSKHPWYGISMPEAIDKAILGWHKQTCFCYPGEAYLCITPTSVSEWLHIVLVHFHPLQNFLRRELSLLHPLLQIKRVSKDSFIYWIWRQVFSSGQNLRSYPVNKLILVRVWWFYSFIQVWIWYLFHSFILFDLLFHVSQTPLKK